MKVALIAHGRHPIAAPFAGGLESFTWYLARGLARRGHRTVVLAGPGSDPALGAEELAFEPVELSARARADVSMPPGDQVQETFAYLQAMGSLARRDDIDVVHNNALHYLPVVLAPTLPAPMLVTLHTPPTPWLEPALRLAPSVVRVAVSRATANTWGQVGIDHIIPNGVDLELWRPGTGGASAAWAGRIVPEKAPHLAALAAHRAGVSLRLAGPISDPVYFETVLAPLLHSGVDYVGHLDPFELQQFFATSRFTFVTPAWEEPFGLVAAESMATGTPVLAIGRGGLPEFVHAGGGVTVRTCEDDDDQAEVLADHVAEVCALDRGGVREHAEQHCSLATTVHRYVELYQQLAQ